MNWRAECAAVIPCLNEATTVAAVVTAVRETLPKVLVVDDGSIDGTAELARRAGAEVLRHETNRGKGAALQLGWRHARALGFAWALTIDGDGQHCPGDAGGFFECAERTSAKLVVGNRMGGAPGMPWFRRQVNRWMSQRLSKLAGRSLPDSQCGFRLMRLDAWASLPIETAHFEIESEVLVAFVQAGFPVEFVPVSVIYKDELSKIHPWQDTVRWFRWWRRVRAMREG